MMRNQCQHSVWVLLMLTAAVCSILSPHAIAQEVNASVNSSSASSAVVGANVSAAVNANERVSINGFVASSGGSGSAGPVHITSEFSSGSAWTGGGANFSGSVNLPAADQLRMSASQYRSRSFESGARPSSNGSGSGNGRGSQSSQVAGMGGYAVLGQFPDSTRGTGWPSPSVSYSPYGVGFSVSPLTWKPDFNSVDHLKISYLVSLAQAKYLKSLSMFGRKAHGRQTELQRLTNALKHKKKSLAPNVLMNPLGSQDGSDLPDQLK